MKYTKFVLTVFVALAALFVESSYATEKALDGYQLSVGDKVRVTVFDEADLSGEFEVDDLGNVSLSLVGNVQLAGKTLLQAEELIEQKFKDGYLVAPRVTLDVLDFKPFYILGEVNKPGGYPYTNGLTVLNAVALAGGYTYRAKEEKPVILRIKDGQKVEIKASESTLVLPGDVVKVDERFF